MQNKRLRIFFALTIRRKLIYAKRFDFDIWTGKLARGVYNQLKNDTDMKNIIPGLIYQ